MKPLSITQINTLIVPKQHFRDCYLVSSLSALARSKNGKKILQQNIKTDNNAFCVRFNNVDGNSEQYLVTQEECDRLILLNKYLEPVNIDVEHNPIVKVLEVAMNKLLKLHPDKKPLYSKMLNYNEDFEFNKPSSFLSMFTGKRPLTINESTLKNSLNSKSKDVSRLLDAISCDNNSSFLVGTGFKPLPINLPSWHCYNIASVDKTNKTLKIQDNRYQTSFQITYDYLINEFKYICGYFNENLM